MKINSNKLIARRSGILKSLTRMVDLLYKNNDDLINHYEWISTLDSRTSDICIGLDGNIYPVGKGRLPPAHFNCRSTTAPILKVDQ